jgi:hypothetical protein
MQDIKQGCKNNQPHWGLAAYIFKLFNLPTQVADKLEFLISRGHFIQCSNKVQKIPLCGCVAGPAADSLAAPEATADSAA